ncbi:MAG TPA: hypothetical protein VM493_04060 [Vicinamibacterales bacterium]|nr:hypothetical protein [Vicinamibacterales bacterium]
MYGIVLIIHSWLRWAVIAAGIAAVARGGARDSSTGRWFTILLDVQMLIGLLLYFVLSPFTKAALGDFGGAMGNSQLRFFAVEHVFGMVIGLALAHIGTAKIRKAPEHRRGRLAMIFYGLALIAILASIPWPGMPAGRPLFRF